MTWYAAPRSLDAAIGLLAEHPFATLAGGTDLYPGAGRTLKAPTLDLAGLAELDGIAEDDAGLRIGARTTWSAIAAADVPPALDALRAAALQVGGRQIQNVGTIGGNLCNASPAADGAPPLLALDAAVELAGPRGRRVLPLGDFLIGPRRTARAADELMTAVLIPRAALDGRALFLKLGARSHLVISIAMVAVRIALDGGRVRAAAVAVGACGPTARRLATVEATLAGAPAAEAASRVRAADVAAALAPIDDVRADAAYRAEAAAILVARAVGELCA
jgi:CO/xanthine dehydrogenase FAD-binding subunit